MEYAYEKNTSLLPYNTFGIDARAKYFARFDRVERLVSLLHDGHLRDQQTMILGGGSNILLTHDFEGVILKNEIPDITILREDAEHKYVQVGAGVVWHDFVLYCIENNLAGIENLSLIPGSVGAAPMQNIGAYGVEIKDVFESLEAYHIEKEKVITFDRSECNFGYRESIFKKELKNKCVILQVVFRLDKKPNYKTTYGSIQEELEKNEDQISIRAISDAVIRIRQSKLPDPKITGNAGSFFKNPVIDNPQAQALKEKHPDMVMYPVGDHQSKLAAGWLIDHLGWKGKTFDNYGVHHRQALVLVNHGGAIGQDILHLSDQIISSVKDAYGILLEREVNIY